MQSKQYDESDSEFLCPSCGHIGVPRMRSEWQRPGAIAVIAVGWVVALVASTATSGIALLLYAVFVFLLRLGGKRQPTCPRCNSWKVLTVSNARRLGYAIDTPFAPSPSASASESGHAEETHGGQSGSSSESSGEVPGQGAEQRSEIELFRARVREALADLEIYDNDFTWEIVVRQYRDLAKKYHPDHYSHTGIPEDVIQYAAGRFETINRSYEYLRRHRRRK